MIDHTNHNNIINTDNDTNTDDNRIIRARGWPRFCAVGWSRGRSVCYSIVYNIIVGFIILLYNLL